MMRSIELTQIKSEVDRRWAFDYGALGTIFLGDYPDTRDLYRHTCSAPHTLFFFPFASSAMKSFNLDLWTQPWKNVN
jgi:hypothetical protein